MTRTEHVEEYFFGDKLISKGLWATEIPGSDIPCFIYGGF
jgi:hypothetical protein